MASRSKHFDCMKTDAMWNLWKETPRACCVCAAFIIYEYNINIALYIYEVINLTDPTLTKHPVGWLPSTWACCLSMRVNFWPPAPAVSQKRFSTRTAVWTESLDIQLNLIQTALIQCVLAPLCAAAKLHSGGKKRKTEQQLLEVTHPSHCYKAGSFAM